MDVPVLVNFQMCTSFHCSEVFGNLSACLILCAAWSGHVARISTWTSYTYIFAIIYIFNLPISILYMGVSATQNNLEAF